jgi:hypothetical protein
MQIIQLPSITTKRKSNLDMINYATINQIAIMQVNQLVIFKFHNKEFKYPVIIAPQIKNYISVKCMRKICIIFNSTNLTLHEYL